MSNIIKKLFKEKIKLSVYHENDTDATRVTGNVDGHDIQIVQKDEGGRAVVSVDGKIRSVDLLKDKG